MSRFDVRYEQPRRDEFARATPPATTRAQADYNALIVMVLSLACTALAIFDLLLLASGQ